MSARFSTGEKQRRHRLAGHMALIIAVRRIARRCRNNMTPPAPPLRFASNPRGLLDARVKSPDAAPRNRDKVMQMPPGP